MSNQILAHEYGQTYLEDGGPRGSGRTEDSGGFQMEGMHGHNSIPLLRFLAHEELKRVRTCAGCGDGDGRSTRIWWGKNYAVGHVMFVC